MAEDEGECAVDVRNAISGESLSTFRLASSSRVLHVKRRVQGAHRISTFGQRLLLWPTGRPLEDHEVLATLPGPPASRGAQREPLAIMLVRLSYVDADAGLVRDLLHAAERGAADDLRRLLGLPMWPDYSNTGHLAAVLNPWGPFGTPLTLASRGGHPEAVRLLLDAGADKDNTGTIVCSHFRFIWLFLELSLFCVCFIVWVYLVLFVCLLLLFCLLLLV